MLAAGTAFARGAEAKDTRYILTSPDGAVTAEITAGDELTYNVRFRGTEVLGRSTAAMHLEDGRTWGCGSTLARVRRYSEDNIVEAPLFMRSTVRDCYNALVLEFREGFDVEFRAANDGVAYRFASRQAKPYTVADETARFALGSDARIFIAYNNLTGERTDPYFTSFENTYTHCTTAEAEAGRLAFTPLTARKNGVTVCIAEADTEEYPGMFLCRDNDDEGVLCGRFAPMPARVEEGGYNMLQGIVRERETFIARCRGRRTMPWRIIMLAEDDCGIAQSDMVWRLASPSRVDDTAWIRPGKVAWEWWNNCGLRGAEFTAGINMPTYKAYIDFASKHGIEYVILDEGWSLPRENDLMKTVPELDLPQLVRYADSRGVGIILWAGYNAFARDMEGVCGHYSKMGVKGFKIDFCDRDDAEMTAFHYRAAATAARHGLLLDFHGTYKPTGLNRTYPNVLNFEAVYGLEQMKWADTSVDHPQYDVTIPFARLAAGPADYTPGAMRNASKNNFRAICDEPMSQGTRCHQLAAYVVFFAPLAMMCDSPSMYEREPECLQIMARIPTVWDRTEVLDGQAGEYVVTARQKDGEWYVGGMTSWTPRTLDIDLSRLSRLSRLSGDEEDVEDVEEYTAEIFRDGTNAAATAADFLHEYRTVRCDDKLSLRLAPGGGFLIRLSKRE